MGEKSPATRGNMDVVKLRQRSLDKNKARAFVYHPDEKPLMVYEAEKLQMYDAGWFDSPAKFPGIEKEFKGLAKELGTDTKDPKFVEGVKKTVDKVAKDTNDELNLKLKSAKELKKYTKKHFPEAKFAKNATKKQMLELIEEEQNKEPVVHDDTIIIGDDVTDEELQELDELMKAGE